MWHEISYMGDAALTLPLALVCATWLSAFNRPQAVRWLALLSTGMTLVGATKVLYAGCGFEISQFDSE